MSEKNGKEGVDLSRYTVNLSGKDYLTYAGVLAVAHERGLLSIETALLQVPGPDNDHLAIVRAVVTMKDGTRFEELGDASPRNVNARIATALIRMAATRAKGRALRDAVNVGETLAEEIPEGETAMEAPTAPNRPPVASGRGNGRAAEQTTPEGQKRCSVAACGKPLTPAQVTASEHHSPGRLLCPSCRAKVAGTA